MHTIKLSLLYLFHPLETFDIIKRERNNLRIMPVLVLYLLALSMRILSVFITHYPLADIKPGDLNFLLEAGKLLGPVFSFVLAGYAISSISGGEAKFSELLHASAFVLIPYIIFTPVIAAISNLLSLHDLSFYNTLIVIKTFWMFMFLYIAFVKMNGLGFFKGIGIGLISLVFCLLIWGLLLLFISLTIQTYSFISRIIEEVNMKYFM